MNNIIISPPNKLRGGGRLRRYRKRFFLIAFLSLSLWQSESAAADEALCVYPKTGSPIHFALKDKPKVSFSEESIVFSSEKESIEYPFSEFRKFTFEEWKETGISNTVKDGLSFAIDGNILMVSNGLPNTPVYVYDTTGMLRAVLRIGESGACHFYLEAGIYIIKSNNNAFKIRIQ